MTKTTSDYAILAIILTVVLVPINALLINNAIHNPVMDTFVAALGALVMTSIYARSIVRRFTR